MRFVCLATHRPADESDQEFYPDIHALARALGGPIRQDDPQQVARLELMLPYRNKPVMAVVAARNGHTEKYRCDFSYETFATLAEEGPFTCGYPRDDFDSTYYFMAGQLWVLRDDAYASTEEEELLLTAAVLEKKRSDAKALAKAAAVVAMGSAAVEPVPTQRRAIPDDVKMFVWQRDQGRCVSCDSNAELEFDHIIPLVMGGSNTARNLQLLCGPCNRAKGGSLV